MARYQVRDDVVVEHVAGEMAVMHGDGDISVLNASASLVLAELGHGFGVKDVAELLTDVYGIDAGRAQADATSLVGQLLSEGVVTPVEVLRGENSCKDMSKRAALAAIVHFPKALANREMTSAVPNVLDAMIDAAAGGWTDGGRRVWKDSLGVEVRVPRVVRKVAPFGPYAQALLESACPERVVWAGGSGIHASASHASLPTAMKLGSERGQQSRSNLRLLATLDADLVIEVATTFQQLSIPRGEAQPESTVPVVRIVTGPGSVAQTYRALGSLLGSGRAMELADLVQSIEDALAACRAELTGGKQKRIFFGMGESGLDTLGRGTLLSSVAESVGLANAASVMPRARCSGLSLEDVKRLDPDLVVLARRRRDVAEAWDDWDICPVVYAPERPYPWLVGNPLVMQTLGALWLGNAACPESFSYDMASITVCCFHALFNKEITMRQASELLCGIGETTDGDGEETA